MATLPYVFHILSEFMLRQDLHKRNRVSHQYKTGLNPSFSYCMARAAKIKPGDVVIDPLCGVGTITNEAALEWPHATYFGGDIDAESIEQARVNAAFCKSPVSYFVWDSTTLPLKEASVDIIFSDLPFGHRHGSTRGNQSLYPKLFSEFHRVLKLGGKCLLVTTQKSLVKSILQSHTSQWRMLESYMVDVGGFMAQLYHLEHAASYVKLSDDALATILSSPKSAHPRHTATSGALASAATASAPSPHTIFSSMSPALSGHHGMLMNHTDACLSAAAAAANDARSTSVTVSMSAPASSALCHSATTAAGPPPFELPTASVAPMIASSPALRAAFAPLLSAQLAPNLTLQSSSTSSTTTPPISSASVSVITSASSSASGSTPPLQVSLAAVNATTGVSGTAVAVARTLPGASPNLLAQVSPSMYGASTSGHRPALVLASPSMYAQSTPTQHATQQPLQQHMTSPSLSFVPSLAGLSRRVSASNSSAHSSAQPSPALPPVVPPRPTASASAATAVASGGGGGDDDASLTDAGSSSTQAAAAAVNQMTSASGRASPRTKRPRVSAPR